MVRVSCRRWTPDQPFGALGVAALATEDYGPLERYVQGWYLHVIALQIRPGWAAEWDQLRRSAPTVADPDAAEPLEDILARLHS